jgi:tetratricopeptide (TPR) repeat protein
MDQPSWSKTTIDAFIEERYDDCIEILVHQPELEFTCVQLLLISLLRAGHKAFAESILDEVLVNFPAESLESRLILLMMGKQALNLKEEASKLQSPVDLCRLHFYAGQMLRTFGRHEVEAAAALYTAAMTEADCLEQIIAERTLVAAYAEQVGMPADGGGDVLLQMRLNALLNAGDEKVAGGQVLEGVAQYQEALAIALEGPDAPRSMVGVLHQRIGLILASQDGFDEALPHLESALEIMRPIMESRKDIALTMTRLGTCRQRHGEHESALSIFTEAHEMWVEIEGENAPQTITALDDIAYTVELMGDLERAQATLESVLQRRTEALGPEDTATLESVTALASLLEKRGDLKNALHYREMEATQRTETFGLLAQHTLEAYDDLFQLLIRLDSRDAARAMVAQISAAAKTSSAEEGRCAMYALATMANTCHKLSAATFGVECALAAVELAKQILKPGDNEMIDLTGSLAEAYRLAGRLDEALRLNEECLELRRQKVGPETALVALSLNNLAQVHQDLGHFNEALELMTEALRIDRLLFGECHHAVAGDLNNIGNTVVRLGEYARARDYYREAIQIWARLYPDGQIHLGTALGNLGRVYLNLGDIVGAQRFLERSLTMLQKVAGHDHPATMSSLASLAMVRDSRLETDKAKEILLSAIEKTEPRLGSTHRDTMNLRTMLAQVDDQSAPRLVDDARSIMEGGPLGFEAATLFDEKAQLLAKAEDFKGAEAEWHRALKCVESSQGITPLFDSRLHYRLAAVQTAQGKLEPALANMRQAIERFGAAWNSLSLSSTEVDREGLLRNAADLIANVFTLLVDYLPGSTEAAELALECTLRYKALQSSLLEREHSLSRNDPRPEIQERLQELRRLKGRINDELMVNPGSRGTLFNVEQIKEWQLDYRRVSEELAQLLGNAEPHDIPHELRRAIVSRLPADAGLIEIVEFEYRDFHNWTIDSSNPILRFLYPPRYVAFLLRPDRVSWAIVGTEEDLLILSRDFLHYITEQESPREGEPRGRNDLPLPGSLEEAALSLRKAVLDSIDGVWDCERLFIAPAGILANVPFELFPARDGGTLLERHRIVYLSSGRDLLKPREDRTATQTAAVVVANPAFDLRDDSRPVSLATLGAFGMALASASGDQHLNYYEPLAGTIEEGNEIARQLGATLWVGADANKSNLMSVRSPRVLHLATHGFSPAFAGGDIMMGNMFDSIDHTLLTGELMQPSHLNKSGLVLAGANWKAILGQQLYDLAVATMDEETIAGILSKLPEATEQGTLQSELYEFKLIQQMTAPVIQSIMAGAMERHRSDFMNVNIDPAFRLFLPPAEAGSGILTAEEATWLDLSSTELVVLSACGTGLGLHSFGDGLLGLRRSFLIAGARTLICSLWKVPDRQTAALMSEFYSFALAGDDCDEALRKAKLKLKRTYPDQPYYWAAFVCYGDPRPLGPAKPTPADPGDR